MNTHTSAPRRLPPLVVATIGVVFGDIGTSPIYAVDQVFTGTHPLPVTPANVLGVLSLVLWSLVIVVSMKYVIFVMRADNEGEGGIMAMIALLRRTLAETDRRRRLLFALGILGAALFYGDGVITPAISVLSAVEGLEIVAPALASVVPLVALVILIALFAMQRFGTSRVGFLFGPVMVLWFGVLAATGIVQVIDHPGVLWAISPLHAVDFFLRNRWLGFLALGAVVLVVTGAEALYADMGHFGKKPIRVAWFGLVLPALLLNYFGQGALILNHPEAVDSPFYHLVPYSGIFLLLPLATVATVIASQAVITGAFSVTRQAVQLGYLPRMQINHTSRHAEGEIYVPFINLALLVGIVLLVVVFRDSTHLAAAYGIAVTGAMAVDSVLGFFVAVLLWRSNRVIAIAGLCVFLAVDLAFFSANALKIPHGGWFPLVVALAVFTLLSTWKRGRELLTERLDRDAIQLEPLLASLAANMPERVPGTAVFLNANPSIVPRALLHNLAHNKILHQRLIFATVVDADRPHVRFDHRTRVTRLGQDIYRVVIQYGFMEEPDIPRALRECQVCGGEMNLLETSFFLSRETVIPGRRPGMALWREHLFIWMMRNAESAMTFFRIPVNRVIELGMQVEI